MKPKTRADAAAAKKRGPAKQAKSAPPPKRQKAAPSSAKAPSELSSEDVIRIATEVARQLKPQQEEETTFGGEEQPGTQAPDRHHDEEQAQSLSLTLEAAMRAQEHGECNNPPAQMSTLSSPLGIELAPKIKAKIWQGEYVNLMDLVKPFDHHPVTMQVVMGSGDSHPAINVAPNNRPREVANIHQWTEAFYVYMAVFLQKTPSAGPLLCKYATIIRAMEQKFGGDAWRSYDRKFRSLRLILNLPWDQIYWAEYLEVAVTPLLSGYP